MAERKKTGYGESPLVVLSLIISMASVIVGGIAWVINYNSSLVSETELNEKLAGRKVVVESQLADLEKRFESLRLDLRLTVIKDVLRSKEMELDMYQQMVADKDKRTNEIHRARIIELQNDISALRVERDVLIREMNNLNHLNPKTQKRTIP